VGLHTLKQCLLQPFQQYIPSRNFFCCLPVMAVSGAQQHPDWEWIFIPNMANVLEMEEELADPRSWYLFARNYPANFLEENFYRVKWPNDEHEELWLPLICVSPRPFRNSMWICDVVIVDKDPLYWQLNGAAALVREIPSPLVLTCCLSETPLTFIMIFLTLAGNEVGQKGYPKEDGDQDLSKPIIDFADDVAHEQSLLTSENQKLCIVVEGLPRLVPDGTVLEFEP